MSSLNLVQLIGNLGRDVEMRYLPDGTAVASLAIATSETWKDKQTGEKKEKTEWHRVSMFARLAEVAGQYLAKGSKVYISGSLSTRKYTDKDGVEKYTTEIRATEMKMLSSRQDGCQDDGYQEPAQPQRQQTQQRAPAQQQRPATQHAARPAARPAPDFSDMDDDIPFGLNANDASQVALSKALLRAKYGRGNSVIQANRGEF